jgi:hypothetical protein
MITVGILGVRSINDRSPGKKRTKVIGTRHDNTKTALITGHTQAWRAFMGPVDKNKSEVNSKRGSSKSANMTQQTEAN